MSVVVDDVREWAGDVTASDDVIERALYAVVNSLESRYALPATFTDDIDMAIVMATARLLKRQSTPEGISSFDGLGVIRVGSYDADVEQLLSPYRTWNFA